MVWGLEGTSLENWLQGNLRKKYVDRPCYMRKKKNVKIFVSSVSGHQMVILAEGNFNKQVDRMTYYILRISASLSQHLLLPLPSHLKQAMMA